jgi:hypothetical protein
MAQAEPHAGVAVIVSRIRLDAASREIADALRAAIPAFERLSGASRGDIVTGVQRSLLRWSRWVATRVAPTDEAFDPLRDWARARADEGVRLEDLLRAFGVARQIGWDLIRRHAASTETQATLDAAGLLMRYVDRVGAVVADTYLAERDALVSEEERRTRDLLERLGSGQPLEPRELDLAEQLGVRVKPAYAPFAVVLTDQPPRRYATLAARLRQRGLPLTVTDGTRVGGLSEHPLGLADVAEGPDALLVVADPTAWADLARVRNDVVLLAEHGRRTGRRGRLRIEDHPMEILLHRLPDTAGRLRTRVLEPLAAQREELLRTLEVFVRHDYDRAATTSALHVHRNTLAYRLRRIEEVTGLDLSSARDLALVYLAHLVHPHNGDEPISSDGH